MEKFTLQLITNIKNNTGYLNWNHAAYPCTRVSEENLFRLCKYRKVQCAKKKKKTGKSRYCIRLGELARLAEIGVRLGKLKVLCSLHSLSCFSRHIHTVKPTISYEYIHAEG